MGNYYWSRSSCGEKDHLSSPIGKRCVKQEGTSLSSRKEFWKFVKVHSAQLSLVCGTQRLLVKGWADFNMGGTSRSRQRTMLFWIQGYPNIWRIETAQWSHQASQGGSAVKNLLADTGDAGDEHSAPAREDSLEKAMATYASVLPAKSCGLRSLAGYSPRGHKVTTTTKGSHLSRKKGLPRRRCLKGGDQGAVTPEPELRLSWRKLLPQLTQQRWTQGGAHSAPLWEAQLLLTEAPRAWVWTMKLVENCSLSWESRRKGGETGAPPVGKQAL